jgi:hypothetical protein
MTPPAQINLLGEWDFGEGAEEQGQGQKGNIEFNFYNGNQLK